MKKIIQVRVVEERSAEQLARQDIGKSYKTCKMHPSKAECFQANKIKKIINEVLQQKLKGKNYNPSEAEKLVREISKEIDVKLQESFEKTRYKYVVHVQLGQKIGAGCRYIAKCFWDAECDTHVTDKFSSATMFCVCTVFGIYYY